MNTTQKMTKEAFEKRFATLCLKSGMAGFPKVEADQHILLKSAMLALEAGRAYTEKEINDLLEAWVSKIARIPGIDRASLRRKLVDTGYLLRSKDGSSYEAAQPGPGAGLFEPAVDGVDPAAALAAAREEIERRKREFANKR